MRKLKLIIHHAGRNVGKLLTQNTVYDRVWFQTNGSEFEIKNYLFISEKKKSVK